MTGKKFNLGKTTQGFSEFRVHKCRHMKKRFPFSRQQQQFYPGRYYRSALLAVILFFSIPSLSFDTWWHAECTRKAMTGNGFSADARLATQFSNYLTDFFPAFNLANEKLTEAGIGQLQLNGDLSFEYMHFDAVYTEADLEQNWKTLFDNTVSALQHYAASAEVKPGFRLIVLFNIIGSSLHTIQDFYSHSNWVNLHAGMNKLPAPVWYDVPEAERKKLNLFTGAYPDGSSPGHKNHGDLNKDCSAREYNKEAVDAAERASIDWVKRLMDAAPGVPWAELKAYNIQGDMVMKRFLVTLDATFLTSSSITLDHFDGAQPVKFVFSPEKDLVKEKNMARIAMTGTIGQYGTNIGLAGNTFKLPSPYWSGYKVYHITRDLAAGLMLNNKKYTAPR